MKLIKSLVLVLFATAMITSCGGSGSGDPASVAQDFYKAVMQMDYDSAKGFCTEEAAKQIEESEKSMSEIPAEQLKMIKEASKLNKVEVTDTKISEDGNSATVTLKASAMGMENTLPPLSFIKENGKWKINQAI